MYNAIKKLSLLCLILLAPMLWAGTARAQDKGVLPGPVVVQPQDLSYRGRYRIGFQDQLEIEVFKHKELSVKVDVADDGTIKVPQIEEPITAVCKTERELADELVTKYARYLRNPYISVHAGEQKSQSFAVMGAVTKPGAFFLDHRITLLELLSYAGGPSDKAGTKIIVARTGSTSVCQQKVDNGINLDVTALNNPNNPDLTVFTLDMTDVQSNRNNMWMQAGDIVSVMEADVIYVVGNVVDPRPISIKKEMTLSQAIAAAKGLKPSTKKGNIRVLRKKVDSTDPEVLTFNLADIEKGTAMDPVLRPDDIVAVSEDPAKILLKSVISALTGSVGYLPYYLRF
jgi:polysaccharide biosynthesis/export protein